MADNERFSYLAGLACAGLGWAGLRWAGQGWAGLGQGSELISAFADTTMHVTLPGITMRATLDNQRPKRATEDPQDGPKMGPRVLGWAARGWAGLGCAGLG